MEAAKLLIEELAQLTGTELEFSDDAVCELTVGDQLMMLRYRAADDDWLYFGFVTEGEEELSPRQIKKALSLNLFGAETLGHHLGLFGNSLILSGTVPMDSLTAEAFAEKIIFLSKCITDISAKISDDASEVTAADSAEVSFSTDFISV